ncbi:uncharacterized protein EV422DRAFT_55191 [Fimicolochytrium jonesii]|uniref:uncharacterized protein n=1 Tax=Fimicolochytrium jonesii TaxID=1396493 RepID=UPI0022FE1EA9|nr:uncharacterized protein EV422DRAFT_55191 [Fimicolochytrium jonesii]KAI8821133.1 hypothetical protein EV422DRAFT_55191 [Fimicolochytrium jonesii]
MALVDKCSCHLHHQPHAPQDGCATTAQASTQQQADVKPEKVHKPNVILISLGGHGDRPKYIGRKGSDGTIISPADERGAASNSASSARHRSVTAGPSGSTSALAPPSTGPSHECIDCKNTVSAIWWQRAEVLKALGMEPVEKTHKDDAKQPADTPADAIAAGNTNNDKKRKLLSDDGHDSDPAQPSSLAADDGKPQSEPEVLGRGMRTKRRKSNPGFCEEDSGSSSSPPPPVLVPSDVNRPSHKRKSRDDDAAEQGDYGEYQSRSVGKRGRKSTVSIGPGDDGRLVIKVQPSVDKSQTGMVVDAVSSKMVAEKAKEDMICHNCWWKLKDAAATHDPEA